MYTYKCRHCGKTFKREDLIKRSFCEEKGVRTNLINLTK